MEEGLRRLSYYSLARWCGDVKALQLGRRLHVHMAKTSGGQVQDTYLANLLVHMYGACGSLEDAQTLFNNLRSPDLFSWNLLISAYAQNGHPHQALSLFQHMLDQGVEPDKCTFLAALSASASLADLEQGRKIHELVVSSSIALDGAMGTALVNMYGKCGSPWKAWIVFDRIPEPNVFSWTAIISAYAQSGHILEAHELFVRMGLDGVQPNKITFLTLLDACADLFSLEKGREMHGHIVSFGFNLDLAIQNALLDMYGKCGGLKEARKVFDRMLFRDVVSWTTMIAVYTQNGHAKEAISLFERMDLENIKPNMVTFLCIIDACANAVSLKNGREVYNQLVKHNGFKSNITLNNALINMYGKCGSVKEAWSVFESMRIRDVISWTAIVVAYAENGCNLEALKLCRQMDFERVNPNRITFLCVFNSCSHAGLTEEGWDYLVSMPISYKMAPLLEHYMCIIDLLGRAGCLNEAEGLITNMPVKADFVVAWNSLLGAFRTHCDIQRVGHSNEHAFDLDPNNDLSYVLLSDIFVCGRKDETGYAEEGCEKLVNGS